MLLFSSFTPQTIYARIHNIKINESVRATAECLMKTNKFFHAHAHIHTRGHVKTAQLKKENYNLIEYDSNINIVKYSTFDHNNDDNNTKNDRHTTKKKKKTEKKIRTVCVCVC